MDAKHYEIERKPVNVLLVVFQSIKFVPVFNSLSPGPSTLASHLYSEKVYGG